MIFLYETGMRLSEIVNIQLSDIIRKEDGITIRIKGKGSKIRYVPLLEDCVRHLNAYISAFHPYSDCDEYLFYTIHNTEKTKMSERSNRGNLCSVRNTSMKVPATSVWRVSIRL